MNNIFLELFTPGNTLTQAFMQVGFTSSYLAPFLVSAIPGLINASLAAYVFFTMPRRLINSVFVLSLIASTCWEMSAALMSISTNQETAFLCDNLMAPLGMLTAPLIIHFIFLLIGIRMKRGHRYFLGTIYFATAVISAWYPSFNHIENYVHDPYWGWINTRLHSGAYGVLTGLFFESVYLYGIFILIRALFRTPRGSEKYSQILLILAPYSFIIIQSLITEAILPMALGINPIPLSAPTSALFSIGCFIAVKKFKLFGGVRAISREELLATLTDIVIVVDSKLHVAYVNKAGLDFIQRPLHQIENMPLSDLLKGDNAQETEAIDGIMRQVLEGERVRDMRCKLISPEETTISILLRADPLIARDEDEGVLLVCRDVTEIEEAQEETERHSRRFKKIIEESKDAITISDLQGIIQYASPSVDNVLGYEPEEIEGVSFTNYVHPDSIQDAMDAFIQTVNGLDEGQEKPFKCLHKDGRTVWLEASLLNLVDDSDVQGIVTVFRDVTEKRNNELEREKSYALFESLINNVSHAMLVVGQDRTLMKMNHQFCKIFNISLTPEQMVGMGAMEGVELVKHAAKDPDQFSARIKEIVTKVEPIVNEVIEFADGRIFERDYFPVTTQDGKLLGHLWRYVDVTEQLEIQKELNEKNKFLEFTQEIGHMGSWVVNLETGESWWSKEALAIYGLSEAEFNGRGDTYFKYVHPDDLAEVNQISYGAIARHESYTVEHRIVLDDGTVKWVHGRGIAEYDGDKPIKLMGISQDITARKQMEQELIEKNKFLEFTQEIGRMGSWWARIDEVDEMWWSDETLEIYEMTRDEFVPTRLTYFNSIHPDDKELRKKATDAGIASGQPFDYEHRIVLKNGGVKWVYNRAIVEFEGNRPVMLTGIIQDITARKQMEQELIEKNKFLEFTQEIGRMGSWWAHIGENADAWWSKEALAIYGMTEAEFDHRADTYFKFIHPDDLNLVYQVSEKGFASRQPFDAEHRIVLRDGTIKWVYNRLSVEFEGDRPVKMTGIVQDITERKANEEEILEQNAELLKINSELDKFVYSASHDIRSPLTSILGLVNIANEEITDPGARLYFEMISDRVERLDKFTLDIIHFSKNARTELDEEEVHVKPLVEEIVESLKYQEIAQHVSFEFDVEPGLTMVTDRSRLTVVLSNMVSNAIKYQREGIIPFVRISASSEDGDVKFSIQDNGIGISAERLDKIFDMFTRFSQKSTGSGLGLYIVKEIVEKLSGKIEVESTPGEGSRFILTVSDQSVTNEEKAPVNTAA